jgi:hypothetical protein
MTNRPARVPTSRRGQRARLSTGLRSASQSLMFAQIAFFSAARASTSNGRYMRGSPKPRRHRCPR